MRYVSQLRLRVFTRWLQNVYDAGASGSRRGIYHSCLHSNREMKAKSFWRDATVMKFTIATIELTQHCCADVAGFDTDGGALDLLTRRGSEEQQHQCDCSVQPSGDGKRSSHFRPRNQALGPAGISTGLGQGCDGQAVSERIVLGLATRREALWNAQDSSRNDAVFTPDPSGLPCFGRQV